MTIRSTRCRSARTAARSPPPVEARTRDRGARLWDTATGQPRGEPLKHDGYVYAVSFSPDGRTLATASADETARLWDVATGQPRSEPLKHDHRVFAVSFSPDGCTLATACDDEARLWDVPPPVPDNPQWVRLAVEVATCKTIDNGLVRTLTQAEWLERKKLLDARGGDCLHRTWDELTAAEKLELRTPAAARSLD